MKSIKCKPFQVQKLLATVWIMRTNIYVDLCTDLVLVVRLQCIVSGGEVYLTTRLTAFPQ
jgi:hypothetical protein